MARSARYQSCMSGPSRRCMGAQQAWQVVGHRTASRMQRQLTHDLVTCFQVEHLASLESKAGGLDSRHVQRLRVIGSPHMCVTIMYNYSVLAELTVYHMSSIYTSSGRRIYGHPHDLRSATHAVLQTHDLLPTPVDLHCAHHRDIPVV